MNICVFCGSNTGHPSDYANVASELGAFLANANHTLVFGGGKIGLMGILADTMLSFGGQVIGVIPAFLKEREVGHMGIASLEVVETMHERKKRMADITDAFIAIPGGLGTLDELAEILTWKQLGLIRQPVYLLNVKHYFDPLLAQMDLMVEAGFLKQECRAYLQVFNTVSEISSELNTS